MKSSYAKNISSIVLVAIVVITSFLGNMLVVPTFAEATNFAFIDSVCPFTAGAAKTIVEFDTTRLIADQGPFTTSRNVQLQNGEYTIRTYSYDGYTTRQGSPTYQQTKEQWYVDVYAGNTLAGTYGPTTDIADGVNFAEVTNTVATNVTLNGITRIVARHIVPAPGGEQYHSVVPRCVELVKKAIPAPIPAPACEMNVSKTTIMRGESITLSWNSTNTDSASINNTIGAVVVSGQKSVAPTTNTTYTGTFIGTNGSTISCSRSVVVNEPAPVIVPPTCSLSATKKTIQSGEATTIRWTSSNATSANISPLNDTRGTGESVVTPTQTTTYNGVFTNANGQTVSCQDTVTVTPIATTCPFTASADTIVVSFAQGQKIRSDKTQADSQSGPVATNIPAGRYTVSLASYDNHTGIPQSETKEQWFLNLTKANAAGTIVTNAISDLPDNQNYLSEVVNSDLNVHAPISAVTALHAAYYDPINSFGVYPVCASFKLIPVVIPAPTCTLSTNPQNITAGAQALLRYSATDATGGTISNGIGAVGVTGEKTITPTATTTYTATFAGTNGTSVQCSATIGVTVTPAALPVISCDMKVSNELVTKGEAVTLSWNGSNIQSVDITQNVGNTLSANGSKSVVINENTTFTGTFKSADGRTTLCSATAKVRTVSGGGGRCLNCGSKSSITNKKDKKEDIPTPTIVLAKKFEAAKPTFITLSDVPYTGFTATPLMTALFWLVVVALSGAIAYVVTYKNPFAFFMRALSVSAATNQHTYVPQVKSYAPVPAYQSPIRAFAQHNTNLQNGNGNGGAQVNGTATLEAEIENKAHAANILLSPEALIMVCSEARRSNNTDAFQNVFFAEVQKHFTLEDGWILLSKERTLAVLTALRPAVPAPVVEPVAPKVEHAPIVKQETAPTPTPAPTMTYTNTNGAVSEKKPSVQAPTVTYAQSKNTLSVPAFITALTNQKQEEVFAQLRQMNTSEGGAADFIAEVVRELDNVYKHRIEGNHNPNREVASAVALLANGELETIIGMLVESVDYSYSSTRVGSKIAIAKVFEYLQSKKG